jgi:acetolactate synthase-1/2/3 large subunit
MEAINAIYSSNSTIICDVGLNKYYAGLLLRAGQNSAIIFSNGMSSMAFSSGALAAKLAQPERDVIVITGDGGFLMEPQEISTCVQYNINLTILVLNNSGLGLVEKRQRKSFGHGYEVNFGNPDYIKFAESFGAQGYSIRSWAQLEDVLRESRQNKKINLIDVPVNYSEGL